VSWQSGVNTTIDDDPQMARVSAGQQLLFPADPRAICEQIGLNWWAAAKLHEDGWLSFYPPTTPRLDEAQEAELRFVGLLVVAGCDHGMLPRLLGSLEKPYAYDIKRLYFEWTSRRWRLLPEPLAHPEDRFTEWLEELVQSRDVNSLTGVIELGHDALSRVRAEKSQAELVR